MLRGIDYFQLLIDHHNKRNGGPGHEAQLLISLGGPVNETDFRNYLEQHAAVKTLSRVRISNNYGLGYPYHYFTNDRNELPLQFFNDLHEGDPEQYFNIPIDIYREPPFFIRVFNYRSGKSAVMISFHHVLFDFAGVQAFVESLIKNTDPPLNVYNNRNRSFIKKFKGFFREVVYTFREANSRMSFPEAAIPKKKTLKIDYRAVDFSEDETRLIIQNAVDAGLGINQGIYLMSAAAFAMHAEIFCYQKHHKFLWIPVPVNTRKKGVAPALLFNGLTFLFYKLPRNILNSRSELLMEVRKQTLEQMEKDMPAAFIDFTEGYKYMPMPFYYPMLKLPSWGKLSSFSFSVLGKTFSGFEEFFGQRIESIKNFPSNPVSPGITFLFYEYRGKLRLMTSWVKGQYPDEVKSKILEQVKSFLLNK